MNTKTKAIIGVIAVLIIVSIAVSFKKTEAPSYSSDDSSGIPIRNEEGSSATTTSQSYALADVMKHNSKASCWTTISGGVYDVTAWIDKHPGGAEAILYLCGKDGTAAFTGQHGGQARPAEELASFKIGTLSK